MAPFVVLFFGVYCTGRLHMDLLVGLAVCDVVSAVGSGGIAWMKKARRWMPVFEPSHTG